MLYLRWRSGHLDFFAGRKLLRALYVEDNPANVQQVRNALERAIPPITVDVATTCAEALQILTSQSGQYRWVLVNVALADGNGLQVLQHIRQQRLPLAAIAMTRDGDDKAAIQAFRLGADDCVTGQNGFEDHLIDTMRRADVSARAMYSDHLLRVLYVDDTNNDKVFVQKRLRKKAPYISLDAINIDADVVYHLRKHRYDVLLLDCPHNDQIALEIVKQIRTKYEEPIPIVITATSDSEEIATQALRLGVSDYIVKDPAYFQRLPAVLEAAYARARLHQIVVHQERLRDRQRAAESANSQKSRFIANLSHEIRTPMNSIIGLIFLLQQTQLTEQQRDFVEKTAHSAEHLLDILNDTLDLSKIEAGIIELECVDFLLGDVLADLQGILAAAAHAKGLDFLIDIAPGLPQELNGDPLRLKQILLNLAGNAIKFTDSGYIHINIAHEQISGSQIYLKCSVKDSGIGLSEEQKESLFNPYRQADSSIRRRFGGTGLGLALCKEFVGLMGGSIDIISEPGKGSEFRFHIKIGLSDSNPISRSSCDQIAL